MSLGDRVGSLGDRVTSMGERVTLMGEACRARVACTVVGRVGISNMEAISKTSSPSTAVDPRRAWAWPSEVTAPPCSEDMPQAG